MQPQKSQFNPINFLTNPSQLQSFQCIICTEISLHPMRCKTCKKSLCNQCATDQKQKNNRCPYRCTNQPLQLEYPTQFQLQLQFHCPFSPSCPCLIPSLKQFYQHDRVCAYITKQQKQRQNNKWQFKCKNGHGLQLYFGTSKKRKIRKQCAQCQHPFKSRVVCEKCQEFYCRFCRPLPIMGQDMKCPVGHHFVKRQIKSMKYRCDVCEMQLGVYGVGSYNDFLCNFDICEICMKNWPKFQNKIQYCVNLNNYCEVVGRNNCGMQQKQKQKSIQYKHQCKQSLQEQLKQEIQQQAKQNTTNKMIQQQALCSDYIKEQHKLQILKVQTTQKCSWCSKQKPCYKKCPKCKTFYCFQCKYVDVAQNETCQFGHKFQPFISILISVSIYNCYSCRNSYNPDKYFFIDEVCGVILCEKCLKCCLLFNKSFTLRQVSMNNERCMFSDHVLNYKPKNYQIKDICTLCRKKRWIKWECNMCEEKRKYCCGCYRPGEKGKCYCGVQLAQVQVTKDCYECHICKKNFMKNGKEKYGEEVMEDKNGDFLEQKQYNLYGCEPCGFYVCWNCDFSNKQKKQQSHEKQKQKQMKNIQYLDL